MCVLQIPVSVYHALSRVLWLTIVMADTNKPCNSMFLVVTGRTVYHGPRDQVVPFFEQLGFQIPERKGVADFIQEICSEKDQEVQFLCL